MMLINVAIFIHLFTIATISSIATVAVITIIEKDRRISHLPYY